MKMIKYNVRITIDSDEKHEKLMTLLYKYNQPILQFSEILLKGYRGIVGFSDYSNVWCEFYVMDKEITLDKLEKLLSKEK